MRPWLFDPGWLFVLAGMVMLAAWMLLPAQRELASLKEQRQRLEHDHATLIERLRAHSNFTEELYRAEPAFLERLAAAQLRLVTAGDRPAYLVHPVSASPSHRIDQMIARRPRPELPPAEALSMLSRSVSGPLRLWIAAGAVTCLFTGLLIGPALRRREALLDDDDEVGEWSGDEDEQDDLDPAEEAGDDETSSAHSVRVGSLAARHAATAEGLRRKELERWDPWSDAAIEEECQRIEVAAPSRSRVDDEPDDDEWVAVATSDFEEAGELAVAADVIADTGTAQSDEACEAEVAEEAAAGDIEVEDEERAVEDVALVNDDAEVADEEGADEEDAGEDAEAEASDEEWEYEDEEEGAEEDEGEDEDAEVTDEEWEYVDEEEEEEGDEDADEEVDDAEEDDDEYEWVYVDEEEDEEEAGDDVSPKAE